MRAKGRGFGLAGLAVFVALGATLGWSAPAGTGSPSRDRLACSLRDAAARGDVAAVSRQLEAGADPDETDCADRSALLLAAEGCFAPVSQVLLEHGANVNQRDRKGRTPLIAATRSRCPAVVELLARTPGADLNARDESGETAWDLAAQAWLLGKDSESIRILKAAGARPGAPELVRARGRPRRLDNGPVPALP